MRVFSTVLCILILCVAAIGMGGCASLFGPSVEKAQEVAEKRQAEFDEAVADFRAAELELKEVLDKLDQAIKDDDKNAIEKLTAVARTATARYEATKEAAKSAENLFNAAVDDFKNAKSTSDYLGTIFGWISLGLNAVLGTGAASAFVGRARAREAVGGTTRALEKVKDAPVAEDAWMTAKADMHANLSKGALKVIEKLRP